MLPDPHADAALPPAPAASDDAPYERDPERQRAMTPAEQEIDDLKLLAHCRRLRAEAAAHHRQAAFMDEYARGGNGRAAAEAAGYAARSARQQASRLLTRDDIRAGIAERRAAMREQTRIECDELIAMAGFAYDEALARGAYPAAVRAVYLMARLGGHLSARESFADLRRQVEAEAARAAELRAETERFARAADNARVWAIMAADFAPPNATLIPAAHPARQDLADMMPAAPPPAAPAPDARDGGAPEPQPTTGAADDAPGRPHGEARQSHVRNACPGDAPARMPAPPPVASATPGGGTPCLQMMTFSESRAPAADADCRLPESQVTIPSGARQGTA